MAILQLVALMLGICISVTMVQCEQKAEPETVKLKAGETVADYIAALNEDDHSAFDKETAVENAPIASPIASPRGGSKGGSRGGSRGGRYRGGSSSSRYRGGGNTGNIAKPCHLMTSVSILFVIFAVLSSVTRLV